MLISHEYQFIFIKTRKTAGTSIEIALSRYLGPFDVITPITPRDELIRTGIGIAPRNYLNPTHALPARETLSEGKVVEMLNQVNVERRFYNHCPAIDVRAAVGKRIWDNYIKFCFERNPWDRVISEYFFMQKTQPGQFAEMSLETFVEQNHYSLNYPLYTLGARSAVNFVGRFENLQADLAQICQQLRIPYDGWLPHAKGDSRPKEQRVAEMMTPKMIQQVADRCRPEVEMLGYELPVAA